MFHQYRSNSVGIYDVTIPTEKPLGPMPENHRKSDIFNNSAETVIVIQEFEIHRTVIFSFSKLESGILSVACMAQRVLKNRGFHVCSAPYRNFKKQPLRHVSPI